jgi:hypothetical protein
MSRFSRPAARHRKVGRDSRRPWTGVFVALALSGLAALVAAPVQAAEPQRERLQIADPYIELHTGPGRGYPVFFVVAKQEFVEVELRRTDWFKVRTSGGKEGWVHREQLERTLTEAGAAKTFRDVLLDDYLRRRLEMGAAWGRFDSEPMLKLWTAYRMSDALSLEGTLGQVQGVFSGTDYWHIDVMAEPASDRRLSPFFAVGLGRFKNVPNASLVGALKTNANLATASVGLKYHITERFVGRIDYTYYTAFVSDQRTREFRAVTAGLSFFF